jgi:hypothetical protein
MMVNEAMARAYAIFAKSSFCEAQQNMHQLGECAREAGIEERRLLSEARLKRPAHYLRYVPQAAAPWKL